MFQFVCKSVAYKTRKGSIQVTLKPGFFSFSLLFYSFRAVRLAWAAPSPVTVLLVTLQRSATFSADSVFVLQAGQVIKWLSSSSKERSNFLSRLGALISVYWHWQTSKLFVYILTGWYWTGQLAYMEAQWPIGYGVGLRIKRSSVRIRPWPLHWVLGQGSLLPLSQGELSLHISFY